LTNLSQGKDFRGKDFWQGGQLVKARNLSGFLGFGAMRNPNACPHLPFYRKSNIIGK
jgi:hypothetical protein